jgi:hypothetical protein
LSSALQAAERFASALDAEDFARVPTLLAPNCAYHAPEALLIGPDAIVASYRQNAEAARRRFDQIEYQSRVEPGSPAAALITFIDRVRIGGAWHEYRCRQRICVGAGGLIEEIRHDEIAGEKERLEQFETTAARQTRSDP